MSTKLTEIPPAVKFTPRDAVDCNQLTSLLEGHDDSWGRPFKMGCTAVCWLNLYGQPYSTNPSPTILASSFMTEVSVNELGALLQRL